ncbi:molybdopterin cofactor-binding domain-containing protein [Fulvimarina sp. MAC8]|uniref:molybdopterin cofactor-binding domain-containing protein n=1 Tax=Fulvimarina sp. MAC8 TaxID=3162874 RepID=UPI0032EBD3C6
MSGTQTEAITVYRETGTGRETFLRLDRNGSLTAFNGHVDLGTGIETALAQIVAEELDLPLSRVRVVLGDTAHTPNQGPTIASETIQITAVPLRHGAAQIRAELIARAALRLNAPAGEIEMIGGEALSANGAVSYGELVSGEVAALALDPDTPVKAPQDYRIVGQPVPRADLPGKALGRHAYIHDVTVPGMVHGHVVRPPYHGREAGDFVGHSLLGYDEAAVSAMPGFIAVVREADFLAVVAEREDQARRIAEALPVDWRMPPDLPQMRTLADTIRCQPATARACDRSGDFARGIEECDLRATRTYVWPYHLHGSIGPSVSIADWNGGRPILWSGTQNPHMLRADLARLVDLAEESIEIRRHQAAGCYGRNCADDVGADALLLARAVGQPVRVQLTRAQEHLWEPKGAAQVMDVEGGLLGGDLHAYSLDTWYPSNRATNLGLLLTRRVIAEPRPSDMGDRTIVPPYRIPHKAITVHDMAPIVRAAWMRGVSALPNTFAHESFVDEMAYEAKEDPVAFRLRHLDDPRTRSLILRTAEEGGWEPRTAPRRRREGRMAYGQGFAYATYVHGTFPGTAAAAATWICDVAVDMETGEVQLTRVFVGQDQGLVINPDGVRHQIHGNVNQTASRVLKEEVSFEEITVTPSSWATYPLATFEEVPRIETMLVERAEDPALGVGESAAVPAAAAIANAIFDATGVRMREAPFTPERMRAAMGIDRREDGRLPGSSDHAPRLGGALEPATWFGRLRSKGIGLAAVLGGTLSLGALALPIQRAIPPASAPPASSFSAELLENGRQVFAAGNCGDCHTAPGGAPNAGGLEVVTPYGRIHTTNLTPDPETGLGQWSLEAFERAMRHGISRDGTHLYPAFPYTSFSKMTDDDIFALYAYLQTLEPVRQETARAEMIFPANLRPVNALWNALHHDPAPIEPQPARGAEWNRGRYLVEATGHCSACHSPRNLLGAEKTGTAALTGSLVKGWYAPAIAGDTASAFGWSEERYYAYLRTGLTEGFASASGPMADVVANLQALPDEDIQAMAIYLASAQPGVPETRVADPAAAARPMPDATDRIFESACATCHEPALASLATAANIPLSRSAAIRSPDDEALKTVIRQGIEAPLALAGRDMPGFAGELTERQIADLAAYVRMRYAPATP